MATMKEVAEKMFEEMKAARSEGMEGFLKNFHPEKLQPMIVLILSAMNHAQRLEKHAEAFRHVDEASAALYQIVSDAIYLGLNEMTVALMEGIQNGSIPEPPKWNEEVSEDSIPK